jgi:hypothetical protein
MSNCRTSGSVTDGFAPRGLTISVAWALYSVRYLVPPDMHLPSGAGSSDAVKDESDQHGKRGKNEVEYYYRDGRHSHG